MEKKFNINDCVKVKLTPQGMEILKAKHEELLGGQAHIFKTVIGPFKAPKVDSEGYCEFQLWELMHLFGEYLYNGSTIHPIYNDIKISEEFLTDFNED